MKQLKILFFSEANPAPRVSGKHTQMLSLLTYFNRQGHQVDFLSPDSPVEFSVGSRRKLISLGLFRDLYLLKRNPKSSYPPAYFISYEFLRFCLKKFLKVSLGSQPAAEGVNFDTTRQFSTILGKTLYDVIILTDSRWSGLVNRSPLSERSVKILLTEQPGPNEGFAQVWLSAYPGLGTGLHHPRSINLPAIVDRPAIRELPVKEIDLLYVGSDTPENQHALDWFFSKVYPLIRSRVSMLVVGKAIEFIPLEFTAIAQVCQAEDLSPHYLRSRVALCPGLSWKGIYMKIAEAQAYGLPVVCSAEHVPVSAASSEQGCFFALEPEEFAAAILELLDSPVSYEHHSRRAFAWFTQHHESTGVYERLNDALACIEEVTD